jgi:hypothetical protein
VEDMSSDCSMHGERKDACKILVEPQGKKSFFTIAVVPVIVVIVIIIVYYYYYYYYY